MSWGRPPSCQCGACSKCKHAAYVRDWYRSKSLDERRRMRAQRDAERVREADRQRYRENKENPESGYMIRLEATRKLNAAVRRGEIKRGACEACGTTENVQGHHDDYDKPLDVRWLCTVCHAAEHNPEARAA